MSSVDRWIHLASVLVLVVLVLYSDGQERLIWLAFLGALMLERVANELRAIRQALERDK